MDPINPGIEPIANPDIPGANPAVDFPQPSPIPAPLPQPYPMPMPPAAQPVAAPPKTSGLKTFFEGITAIDVAVMALSIGAIMMIIYYYKMEIKYQKEKKDQVQQDIQDLKDQMDNINSMMQQPG